MDSIFRALATYAFMWLVFRITGKRSLAQITTFDFVLLLIISETTQQAMVADDNSMMNSCLLVATFFTVDLALSYVKHRFPRVEKIMDGLPVVIYAQGQPIRAHLDKERIDEGDILAAARELHGLERLDQIKYAILECGGRISIVPRRNGDGAPADEPEP